MTDHTSEIACNLSSENCCSRKTMVQDWMTKHHSHLEKKENGVSLFLDNNPEVRELVADLVRIERDCCHFLQFNTVETQDSFRLDVVGPADAKPLIYSFFDLEL